MTRFSDPFDTDGHAWVMGDGRMARLVRHFDWKSTPLGEPARWPAELKTAINLVLASGFPMALAWGPELVTIYNDAFAPILGSKPEALGRSFRDVWAEAWDAIGPIADRTLAGEATFIEDFELEIERYGRRETAWFTFSYSPVRLADGAVGGMLDTVVETTGTVIARRESELMRDELAHRLRNSLTMVQAMAHHSFDCTARRDAFSSRIAALGRAQDLLTGQGWRGAPLHSIAEPLDTLHGGRIELDGPAVELGPRSTLGLSMVLHELGTNAVKYGALSVPEGRVRLSWQMRDDGLMIAWRETGGPAPVAPGPPGFGTRVIEMGLGELGDVERRFSRDGLEVDLRMALAGLKL